MIAGMQADRAGVREWVDDLRRRGLAITTVNAFPLGSFQGDTVKDLAYQPPWPTPERQQDTQALIALVPLLCLSKKWSPLAPCLVPMPVGKQQSITSKSLGLGAGLPPLPFRHITKAAKSNSLPRTRTLVRA